MSGRERRIFAPLATRLSQLFFDPGANTDAKGTDDAIEEPELLTIAEDASVHERWLVALGGRKAADCSVEELRELVDLGTPLITRHALWPRWWRHPNIGEVEELQGQASNASTVQIDLDLRRTLPGTFPDNQRDALRRVLRAYAAYNPNVGYCQGMNFIAAVPLLLAFSEVDAFLCLRYMVEEVCPDYHGVSLGGYFRDAAVLDALVSQLLPEIHHDFLELDIPFDMLITDHLLTLSARTWPLHAVARLWDVILMEGSPALWASFLALLQVYFKRAVSDSSTACTQLDEVSIDIAGRFLELSRSGIASDIDVVVQHTRKFIPLVRGDVTGSGSNTPGGLVEKLRAQFSVPCEGSPSKDSKSKPSFQNKNVVVASDNGSLEVLIEASLKLEDGSTQVLTMGIVDQPKAVARRFIEEHSLDKCYTTSLAAWLKKIEADAVEYPVKIQGNMKEILFSQSSCK